MTFNKYYQQPYQGKRGYSSKKLEYKKFRVRSAIKSFRDLEVYKATTEMAVEIFELKIPKRAKIFQQELEVLRTLAKAAPKLIAESYGDKYSSLDLALRKLERTMQLISNIITKLDFFVASVEKPEIKQDLNKFIKRYQIQRVKILNLKKAWQRMFKR